MNRAAEQLREIIFIPDYIKRVPGSVLVCAGNTRVLCNVSLQSGVPKFLKGSKRGWLSAEYGMLPSSTNERIPREACQGRQGGRTMEIQRLIGRSLRTCVDLSLIGENTLTIDCDVLEADGGTRTASITGSYVALHLACAKLLEMGKIKANPIKCMIAAVSVGIVAGQSILDLDQLADNNAEVDLNVVMDDSSRYIEVQGTGEKSSFSQEQLDSMLSLANNGIKQIIELQKAAIASEQ